LGCGLIGEHDNRICVGYSMLRLVERHFRLHNRDPPEGARSEVYRSLEWRLDMVSLEDLGVWDGAQGLPHLWCVGNVLDTAREYLSNGGEGSYHEKIGGLSRLCPDVVLDTIIAVDGSLERGREDCDPVKWGIDDGCMRALSYAVRGRRSIMAYLGACA